jgi:hypothetical protein
MDAWWPKLVQAEFGPAIGDDAMKALQQMVTFPNIGFDNPHSYPGFADGWWGFVYKDLRDLFDRKHVRGRWSRVYCGGGSKAKCRQLCVTPSTRR